jgi:transcriptional regulator HilA, main transcriptional regulator of SPI1
MNGLVWRFAGFEYSSLKGLWRDGAQVPIGPQARQLLQLLLESHGAVVSKGEIGERLWPGRQVSDDSIDRCAYLLRKPLRDAGFGDLIATAYGRGLSLRVPVEILDPQNGVDEPASCPVDLRVLDLWQTAYELAGSLTRDGFARAQDAILSIGAQDDASPALWSLSASIAASRVTLGYLRPPDGAAVIERDAGRALALAPDFAPALSVLGWCRAALQGRPDEGLEMLDRAVARNPHYSKARAHRSWALVQRERLEEAIDDMDAALRIAPYDRAHLTMRAWLSFCAGDIDGGARLADEGTRLRPDAAVLRSVLALAASLSDRHVEAETAVRRGLQQAPENPILQTVLAYVLAKAGRDREAEAALALASADGGAPPYIFLSAARLALGDEQAARTALRRGQAEGCPWIAFAPFEPRLEPMREEIARMRREARADG